MPTPIYFVEITGRNVRGQWFLETDRDENSAGAVRCYIRHEGANVVKVLEVYEPCDEYPRGQCLDVTEDIRREALAGVVPEPREFDHQAARFDHAHDLRKNYEPEGV